MIGQQQSGKDAPLFLDALAAGLDFHPLLARPHTRGGQNAAADIDHAQAADTGRLHARVVAEYRDVNPLLVGGFPDGGTHRDRKRLTVESQVNHRSKPYRSFWKSKLARW